MILCPPSFTETEFAVGLFANHRRIAALKTHHAARAIALGSGAMGAGEQAGLAEDVGMDREEAEWQISAAMIAAKLDTIASPGWRD